MNANMISHLPELLEEAESQITVALEKCGLVAEAYAKRECPVDTGALRNSITHTVDTGERKAYVGTNMEYAPYVELGTGIHANGGRQTPWVYKGEDGKFYTTSGQVANPFIKPAAADHAEEYMSIIISTLKGE